MVAGRRFLRGCVTSSFSADAINFPADFPTASSFAPLVYRLSFRLFWCGAPPSFPEYVSGDGLLSMAFPSSPGRCN